MNRHGRWEGRQVIPRDDRLAGGDTGSPEVVPMDKK